MSHAGKNVSINELPVVPGRAGEKCLYAKKIKQNWSIEMCQHLAHVSHACRSALILGCACCARGAMSFHEVFETATRPFFGDLVPKKCCNLRSFSSFPDTSRVKDSVKMRF